MCFLGVIAGLFIGALFESVVGAVVLAFAGAYGLPRLFGKKKKAELHRTEAEGGPADAGRGLGPSGASATADGVLTLQQRVLELEERVNQLEHRLAQGAAAVAVPSVVALGRAGRRAVAARRHGVVAVR